MTEYTLSAFDKQKVKQGASLGMVLGGKTLISTRIEFYKEGTNMYLGKVTFNDNPFEAYNFDGQGIIYDSLDKMANTLYIVDADITKTTGTKIAKVTDSNGSSNARPISRTSVASETSEQDADTTEEIFSIATLQPREEIAMHCLESMVSKYDNPLNIDNTKIKQLVSKSFLFAQEFINQAVLYREKENTSSTVESTKYATVDSESLSSDTDKLLFNISTALTNWMAQNKNQYADQQKNGLKVNTADINVKTTFPDTINANISGSVNATVSGTVKTQQDTTSSAE